MKVRNSEKHNLNWLTVLTGFIAVIASYTNKIKTTLYSCGCVQK